MVLEKMELVEVKNLSYWHPGQDRPAVRQLSFSLHQGEFVLLLGRSGCGKSTLCRALNGLIPHFYGGKIAGRVKVAGTDTLDSTVRELSRRVGLVFQDPESQLVTDSPAAEIAFGLENIGLERSLMVKRVSEVTATLGLGRIRNQRLDELSGGQKQRVALASVLAMQPDVLVLDEPTSQLDPVSADDFLATLKSLNEDLGLCVLLAEHRVERCFHFADRVLVLDQGEIVFEGAPRQMAEWADGTPWAPLPPVTRLFLGRDGIIPPLTVKEGRQTLLGLSAGKAPLSAITVPERDNVFGRHAPLSGQLPDAATGPHLSEGSVADPGRKSRFAFLKRRQATERGPGRKGILNGRARNGEDPPLLEARGLWHIYQQGIEALKGIDMVIHAGESIAVIGENGSGKTTLVRHFNGMLEPSRGKVFLGGNDISGSEVAALAPRFGVLGQNPNLQLVADTTRQELEATLSAVGIPEIQRPDLINEVLRLLEIEKYVNSNPEDLSCGERELVALASVMVHRPDILILDEPTRGLDYESKDHLAGYLESYRRLGKTIIVVTHDLEFAAGCCERTVLMSEGCVLADGHRSEVLADSLFFTTQYNKSFRGTRDGVITAADAARTLEALIP